MTNYPKGTERYLIIRIDGWWTVVGCYLKKEDPVNGNTYITGHGKVIASSDFEYPYTNHGRNDAIKQVANINQKRRQKRCMKS